MNLRAYLSVYAWAHSYLPRLWNRSTVINFLRTKGRLSCTYLEYLLCLGDTSRDYADNVAETIWLVEKLGFIVNYNKSNLTPSTGCEYLGLVKDLKTYSLEPTPSEKKCWAFLVKTLKYLSLYHSWICSFNWLTSCSIVRSWIWASTS